jgi:clan AA aspartic protease (TIGR02281 family)
MSTRPSHSTRLLAGLILFLPAALSLAADPPADAALKEKGLRRSATTYVLAAEAEVQKRLNKARALYRTAAAAAAQKAQFERELEFGKAQMQEAEQQLIQLNQQLAQGDLPTQQHNYLVGTINSLNLKLSQMRRQGSEDTRQVVGARLASDREEFLQSVLDLRLLVDKTNTAYAELANDADVKAALEGLNGSGATKVKYTLGPSRAYLANVKVLESVEANVMSEDVILKKEGGVYWVDATFNGKVTKPMVFDTGASSVVLSAELAASIGLTPGPNDPIVTAQVADGSKVTAHRMTIPSIRVGKFTVANVDCIVMPADKKDVPPLLGQTFQRNFSIKMNADAGKLVLSRLETAEADSASSTPAAKAKAKTSGRTAKGKRGVRGGDEP